MTIPQRMPGWEHSQYERGCSKLDSTIKNLSGTKRSVERTCKDELERADPVPGPIRLSDARRRLVIPPRLIRPCARVQLVRPGRPMLVRQVPVGFGNLLRQDQTIVCALGRPLLREPFRSQHLAKRVRCIHGAVNDDVSDVHALRGEFRVQGLAEHTAGGYRRSVGALARVAPHRRGRGRDQDSAAAPARH